MTKRRELENEVHRITELELPVCMYRKHKHKRHRNTIACLFFLYFGTFSLMIYFQEHPTHWETINFKAVIEGELSEKYSGKYRKVDDVMSYKRDFYYSKETNNTFGFCINNKQWYLYPGNDTTDPCSQPMVVHSVHVDTFDISTSFLSDWFTDVGEPVHLYFLTEKEDGYYNDD